MASAQRAADVQIPSQPSPSRPARRSAASDRPPTTSGILGSGTGRMATRSRVKNSPSWLTSSPASRRRSRPSDSFIRRPRVRGSTPQAITSRRSSPLMASPERGADTIVYLASSPDVAGQTGGYYVKRQRREPSAAARDDTAARELWELSEKMTGLAPARPAGS